MIHLCQRRRQGSGLTQAGHGFESYQVPCFATPIDKALGQGHKSYAQAKAGKGQDPLKTYIWPGRPELSRGECKKTFVYSPISKRIRQQLDAFCYTFTLYP